jgi:hypothetical protein
MDIETKLLLISIVFNLIGFCFVITQILKHSRVINLLKSNQDNEISREKEFRSEYEKVKYRLWKLEKKIEMILEEKKQI